MKRKIHRESDSSFWTRRDFLGATASVTGVAIFSSPLQAFEVGAELPTFRFRVQRDQDLLSLGFSFINFERHDDELRAVGLGQSLLVVRFPPQNLAESVFDREPDSKQFEFTPLKLP